MPWIQTADIQPEDRFRSELDNMQIYCGLDSCVTLEVRQELESLRESNPNAQVIYHSERALQGVYLEIMERGFKVDELNRNIAAAELRVRIDKLQALLNRIVRPIWGSTLNPNSYPQLKDFFYNCLRLPEQRVSDKGIVRVSVNREVLEKLHEYIHARPFVNIILLIRELSKQAQLFEKEIDPDHRFRASYNIAGTKTGRPSSSENAFGTGGNAQNIAPAWRYVFISDPGYKLCVIDLEQVEARDVGYFCGCLFDDWTYLDACESGDLHTSTAKMVWPGLPWTGVAIEDRQIASRRFYRDFTYRDMAKRGGHLSNYMGTARTASRHLKVPFHIMEEFRSRYVTGPQAAYPCIERFWQWVSQQIQTTNCLVTPFRRQRHFFGRTDDDATLREAIAYLPQSTTADRMSLGMWRVWNKMRNRIQLLAETYDSITFQYLESDNENDIIREALELIRVELTAPNGRSYIAPGEAKTGWNWGNYVSERDIEEANELGVKLPRLNLGGLLKWNPNKPDTRTPPERSPLKRIIPELVGDSRDQRSMDGPIR